MLELRAIDLTWVNGQADDPADQCVHGKVLFTLAGQAFMTPGEHDFTLSATGLYLLRTLTDDHTPEHPVSEGNWLFPCCGFNVFRHEGRYDVLCMGCNSGSDVHVRHRGDEVILTMGELSGRVSASAWRAAVLGFVAQIEAFYAASSPKTEIDNDADRVGWALFWAEWRDRKREALKA